MILFFELLAGTVWLRPYVFIFLGAYLLIAVWHLGAGRALAFLVLGYLISWAAEFASIHWGFPFGEYLYIPATLDQELWVAGVPFMDSLSYVFLAYASYSLALVALTPGRWEGRRFYLEGEAGLKGSWRPVILGAVLMMTLDIVIDPLALRGYRWFLGQIYGYPESGVYFGIPLSNFGGWFLVGWTICSVYLFFERPATPVRSGTVRRLDGLFPPISIFLTILCFIGSIVHLRSVLPVVLSLAVLGPCWWFWLASTRPRQPQ